jgi:hypothetical protein
MCAYVFVCMCLCVCALVYVCTYSLSTPFLKRVLAYNHTMHGLSQQCTHPQGQNITLFIFGAPAQGWQPCTGHATLHIQQQSINPFI